MTKTTLLLSLAVLLFGLYKINDLSKNLYIEVYNEGYRQGMLYAYDNVFLCNADARTEGYKLSQIMNEGVISRIECEE